ncbi:UDP pyrophosphate synthase [candidate division TA06 bacterium DG_78]|uniref:Isoprenyl transferase n=1 Tax=candidate division TA06 bacterium DG_78 TaxID=1703772 RepID=A0A0S7YIZ5_UNCT6|nr:MAG: UDP pyrophosphate synthase [candidate division TA06 bacterium DG_78]
MPTQVHHVAIIMDGNGRWAKKRGLPRIVGHRQGVESVRAVVKASLDLGIDYLTLYTFSTENWQRPKREVDTLMKMLKEMLAKETPGLHKNNVRVKVIGRLDDVYPNARKVVDDAIALTKNNDGLVLTFCISYGSRGEIIDAVKKIIMQDRKEHIALDKFDERTFAQFLYDPDLPDPDLLIRTGAENRERISNFLLWQIAYTEIYFTKTLWPDFRRKEFTSAVDAFTQRERLFGRVK